MTDGRHLIDRGNRPAWLVLAICLLLTWLAWGALRQQALRTAERQFQLHTSNIEADIRERLRQHEQILLGAAGLFDASDTVTRSDWHAYIARLQLERNYPGIQGVGFSQAIAPAQLPAHIAAVRAEGFPHYTLRPPGERSLYTAIVYLEPFSDRNLAAFGFDMMSEAIRARAMRRAAESGATAISAKVKLVQETHGPAQAGFLMYLPIYRKQLPLTTAAERWRALQGFVYSPYRVNDLMRGILGAGRGAVDFTLYEGTQDNPETRLYASADEPPGTTAAGLTRVGTFAAYGESWTVRFQSRPGFEASFDSTLQLVVPLLGGGVSLLLFFLLSSLISRRNQAQEMAQQMTLDIRASEQSLRRSQQLLDSIIEHIPAMVFVKRASDLRFELFNRAGEKMLGRSRAEVLGKHDGDLLPRAQADAAMAIDRAVLRAPDLLDIPEEAITTAQGETRYLHTMKIGLRDEQGEASHLLGIAIDITERKRQERIAQERAQQTQAILDNVIDGIITIDGNGRVQSLNRAAEAIFGYPAAEVIGRNVNMLMPEPYHSQHDGYLKNFRDTGVPRIIGIGREVEGRRQDGSTFAMDLAVSQSVHQGQPLFIGLVRDITERKRVQQMKAEFVSTVSHELRTPLTSISGALGLVCGGALGAVSAQAKLMLDIAYKNSQRLAHLINDLLDMEKLVAGKMRFDWQAQDLMPLVEQSIESMQAYADQYQVRLVLTQRADGARVRVDASRLQQVLSNFLSNAAKFSPPGGQVEVAVRAGKGSVRVEVIDHGAGIPAEFVARIFQKFSQADSSDTRQKGGTGLGLAISKELIERMNGLVGFESQAAQGACFHFELPLLLQAPAASAAPNPEPGDAAARLLVVEDDPDIAQLLVVMLTRAGYRVDVADTGELALQMLEQRSYAAMTLDLLLPDLSGVALIRLLRSRVEFELLPIIVVSAFMDDGKLAINGDFAAVDWLDKPIDEARLLAAVQRSLPLPPQGKPRILHVEDDADLHRIVAMLGREVADFDIAGSLTQARERLRQGRYDLVILDVGLPDGSGWQLLPEINALRPAPPVIVLSGTELSTAQRDGVRQALVKSRTSSESLLDTIRQVVDQQAFKPGGPPA